MTAPTFSVIIPCRNEGRRVLAVLDDLQAQDLAEPGEVVVADGQSDDQTRALLDAYAARSDLRLPLRVVDNPRRNIPAGLNAAVRAAQGRLIIRIDGHSRIEPGYVARMLANLRTPGVDVAGGLVVWTPGDTGTAARTISWCLNHPLGNGGTPGRNPQASARRVRHSPLSCYHRRVWEQVGGYDESLLTNEDFEYDWRAGEAGLAVWTFPAPTYRALARATLAGLWNQRWRYGVWKARVARLHPRSLSPRQLAPAAALPLGLAGVGLVGAGVIPVAVAAGLLAAWLLAALLLVIAGTADRRAEVRLTTAWSALPGAWVMACVAFPVIHAVWAAGFWTGLVAPRARTRHD